MQICICTDKLRQIGQLTLDDLRRIDDMVVGDARLVQRIQQLIRLGGEYEGGGGLRAKGTGAADFHFKDAVVFLVLAHKGKMGGPPTDQRPLMHQLHLFSCDSALHVIDVDDLPVCLLIFRTKLEASES